MRKLASLPLCLVLAGVLVLPGCASKYGQQKTRVNYYPQCYQPVSQLRQDEYSTGTSTATGAVGGALLGALIGGLATGKASGALAGAAVGGAAGAVGGNIYGKSKAKERDEAHLLEYSRQLGAEAEGMDRTTAAAKVAAKCYDEQFKLAAKQYKAGQITRMEFQDRYSEIRSGLEETSYILNETSTTMAKKDSEYQQTLAEPYTAARPSTSGRKHSQTGGNISRQASHWKSSREELETTRRDVNSRISSYDTTVNNLLG